jgi:hypothetical protein
VAREVPRGIAEPEGVAVTAAAHAAQVSSAPGWVILAVLAVIVIWAILRRIG